MQHIGTKAARGAAAPGAHHNIMVPRVFDEIPNDQKVIRETHVFDDTELIDEPLPEFIGHRVVALAKPLHTNFFQVRVVVFVIRYGEHGQMPRGEIHFHVALVCDELRIADGLGCVRK